MSASLHLVCPGDLAARLAESAELCLGLADAGVDVIQIRAPTTDTRLLLGWVRAIVEHVGKTALAIIVNGRLDVALAAGAGGVHLGWRSFDPRTARVVVTRVHHRIAHAERKPFSIGVSMHAVSEIEHVEGADYIIFGPVFDTPSKRGLLEPVGLAGLEPACAAANRRALPLVAIGGMTPERARQVWQCGVAGVAVLSGIAGAVDPVAAARSYGEAKPR